MSNVRISELNRLSSVTVDDFIPIVDSGSLTTYRTPIQLILDLVAASGSAKAAISASWASSSISASRAITASHAMELDRFKYVTKDITNTSSYAVDVCELTSVASPNLSLCNILVTMRVWGSIYTSAKTYLLTAEGYSPGQIIDLGTGIYLNGIEYNGYYELKPLSATRNYAVLYNTDFALEVSQSSYGTFGHSPKFTFRVRNATPPATGQTNQIGYCTLGFTFLNRNPYATHPDYVITAMADNKTLSSENLPAWPTAFVEIKDYVMTVSGSCRVEKGITGSLLGTASYALNAPSSAFPTSIAFATSASWASSSLSSSLAITASYAESTKTASYALNTPSLGSVIVPTGTVLSYLGRNIPSGYLICTGSSILISSYSDLASAIYVGDTDNGLSSSVWGYKSTDAAGTIRNTSGNYIKLPDLRGQFLRGWDPSGSYGDTTSYYVNVGTNTISSIPSTAKLHVSQSVINLGTGYFIASINTSTSITLNKTTPSNRRGLRRVIFQGRNWATNQDDQIPSHAHRFGNVRYTAYGSVSTGQLSTEGSRNVGQIGWTDYGESSGITYFGEESRPTNMCVNYIIKT